MPLDVGGVVRDVPLGARTVSWTSQSRLFDGVCQPYVQVGCGDWHLCLDLDDVATFDVLMVPPPFAGPLHAEWR